MIVTPNPARGLFNQTVTLECQILSFSKPNVTWNTTAVNKIPTQLPLVLATNETGASGEIGVYTSFLVLGTATLETAGNYTCTAENEGGVDSDTTTVNITGKRKLGLQFKFACHF